MKLRMWEADRPASEYRFDSTTVRIGRDPGCELPVDGSKYPKVSGLHAELQLVGALLRLTPRSRSNQTLLNNVAISGPALLKAGDRFRLGFTGPEIEVVQFGQPDRQLGKAHLDAAPATLIAGFGVKNSQDILDCERFDTSKGGILGRDSKLARFLLEHPHVSRVHARIAVTANKLTISDLGSANGTYHNGQIIDRTATLAPGDTIDIGPFTLVFDGKYLTSQSRADNVHLVASNIAYEVIETNSRKKIKLLNQVELVINPGEFLCILGPSGSGKSTLLNILSGRRSPSTGNVYVNGRNLHRNFAALKQDLSVVPQSTNLHDSLTVEQSFGFTSELRLPSDLDREELRATVNGTLQIVGLDQHRHVRISHLSGGQLKRAGLGGELLSEPTLLFLDEVTSGLDEHSDGEMMRLFRGLADRGKTLVCITHNLSNIEENCHLIAVLTVGGQLAFLGSPADAKTYFRVNKLADIYLALQTQQPEKWASSFKTHPHFIRYIQDRKTQSFEAAQSSPIMSRNRGQTTALRQFFVLLRRTIAIWRGDLSALGAMFGQSLLVALLLCLVFGQFADVDSAIPMARQSKIRNLLFLLSISCFWLGCNNSVKELVKERSIFLRERDYNLIPESYLFSKLIFFSVIGIAQSLLLGSVAMGWFGMPGNMLEMLGVFIALSFAGTSLGLAISSMSRNEEVAVAIVPIAIIPQIILAGIVASLAIFPEWISRLTITVYWGQKAIEQSLPQADRIASDFQPEYGFGLFMVLAHAVFFLLVAGLWVRFRRE